MKIENLSLTFGLQTIFDDVTILLPEQEKIGIVGVNGAGKTTLFKLILGEIEADHGRILFYHNRKISYLPQVIQDEIPSLDISVLDYLLQARPIEKLQNKITELYTRIATLPEKEANALLKKVEKLQTELDYYEPFEAESILLKLITGMHVDDSLLDQSLKNLSGGQKSKIAFIRLLYSKPDVILLDEPTNHLDKETKSFVSSFLKSYQGSVYIISHDIEFLNEITTKTLYLDKVTHKMELFHGNYEQFLKVKEMRDIHLEKEKALQDKERKRLQGIIDKYIHGNEKKARIAKDRQKKLAKLESNKIELTKVAKTANINLHQGEEATRFPIKLENVCFKYDKTAKRNLLYKINLEIPRGEKFLIVGENGVGKSTLLKLMVGILKQDSGSIILGPKTKIAYYAQEHEQLDNEKNLMENLDEFGLTENEARGVLGRFLFYNEDLYKKVKVLSPGERSRVALAKLTLQKANLLILDEPTNHLDPATQKIIANNLKDFPGTIILVSHNTAFVDSLGINRTLILPEGKLDYYDKKVVEKYHYLNTKEK